MYIYHLPDVMYIPYINYTPYVRYISCTNYIVYYKYTYIYIYMYYIHTQCKCYTMLNKCYADNFSNNSLLYCGNENCIKIFSKQTCTPEIKLPLVATYLILKTILLQLIILSPRPRRGNKSANAVSGSSEIFSRHKNYKLSVLQV